MDGTSSGNDQAVLANHVGHHCHLPRRCAIYWYGNLPADRKCTHPSLFDSLRLRLLLRRVHRRWLLRLGSLLVISYIVRVSNQPREFEVKMLTGVFSALTILSVSRLVVVDTRLQLITRQMLGADFGVLWRCHIIWYVEASGRAGLDLNQFHQDA